jgi:hypothetical protein
MADVFPVYPVGHFQFILLFPDGSFKCCLVVVFFIKVISDKIDGIFGREFPEKNDSLVAFVLNIKAQVKFRKGGMKGNPETQEPGFGKLKRNQADQGLAVYQVRLNPGWEVGEKYQRIYGVCNIDEVEPSGRKKMFHGKRVK